MTEGKRTIRISHREFESINEEMRKDVTKNVLRYSKSSSTKQIGRFVDQDVLTKCVLSQYGKFKRTFSKTELDDKHQYLLNKSRTKGERNFKLERQEYRPNDMTPNKTVEEVYFNLYGKGFDGSELPTQLHQIYHCKRCNLKMNYETSTMPLKCPRCGYITPLGQIIKDKNKKYL